MVNLRPALGRRRYHRQNRHQIGNLRRIDFDTLKRSFIGLERTLRFIFLDNGAKLRQKLADRPITLRRM